jgi:putative two-component system response regulator
MSSKYSVLIVDDVADNLTIVKKILENEGYQTTTASDGYSALNLVIENKFDIILLDIMMPNMSGIEVCQHLKKDPESRNIPVIFVTANADRDTLVQAYDAGGSDYIKKPFFKEELLARVNARLKISDYEKNLESKVEERTKNMQKTLTQIMYILGGAAEGNSADINRHLKRIGEFSYKLAILYGMSDIEAEILQSASYLHDIGKLKISDSVVKKDTQLDKKEKNEMKKHPELGAGLLKLSNQPLLKVAKIIAEQHHEKYNGTGYPHKLRADEIDINARIVTIADVFDALNYQRVHKNGMSEREIITYMKDMKGKFFDPELIDLLIENIDDFLEIYNIEIDTDELQEELSKPKTNSLMGWLRNKI